MVMNPIKRPPHAILSRQTGVALMISLIVLVGISLAGVALVRSVDTASLIAGNLAFRQGATIAGDSGVEAARTWLLANSSVLTADNPSSGYYATSQDSLDITGNKTPTVTSDDVAWNGTGISTPVCLTKDGAGNTACYIIHRLCNSTGAIDAATCSTKQTAKGGSSLGAGRPMTTDQERNWSEVATMAYYRVTVRVAGPRNSTSYIQVFLVI